MRRSLSGSAGCTNYPADTILIGSGSKRREAMILRPDEEAGVYRRTVVGSSRRPSRRSRGSFAKPSQEERSLGRGDQFGALCGHHRRPWLIRALRLPDANSIIMVHTV